MNVSADTDVSNAAIMAQLQALHKLVEGISTRLAAVEKSICKATDDVPDPIEIEPEVSFMYPYHSAEFVNHPILMKQWLIRSSEYNDYARGYNVTLVSGKDTLMPLRTSRNTYIVGFPSTVGHLVSLGIYVSPNVVRGLLTTKHRLHCRGDTAERVRPTRPSRWA